MTARDRRGLQYSGLVPESAYQQSAFKLPVSKGRLAALVLAWGFAVMVAPPLALPLLVVVYWPAREVPHG